MSYSNSIVNWNDIIKFTAEGLIVADYSRVRTALVNRFKEIYGEDIDVSTTSADGVYLETLSLMLNNILQSFKAFYGNLDIRTASGTYLDMLCALTNVYRKDATHSTCSLTITLDEDEVEQAFTRLEFLDNGGLTWVWSDIEGITLTPGVSQDIIVTCSQVGPVRADAGTIGNDYTDGWINQTVEASPVIIVQQKVNASMGKYAETDSELRARQHLSGSASGNTVIDSLAGALFQLTAIEDVLIYNNSSASTTTALDGTDIGAHSIYIVLRKAANVEVSDKQIGTIIHNKMTPGIQTTESEITADSHSFEYHTYIEGVSVGDVQTYYWKQATPVKPQIVITITPLTYFSTASNNTCNIIAENIITELNGSHIGSTITNFNLQQIVSYSDPLFRGQATYTLVSAKLNNSTSNYTLADTYFAYSSSDVVITQDNDDYVITIG